MEHSKVVILVDMQCHPPFLPSRRYCSHFLSVSQFVASFQVFRSIDGGSWFANDKSQLETKQPHYVSGDYSPG
jgi:hypothetical protein